MGGGERIVNIVQYIIHCFVKENEKANHELWTLLQHKKRDKSERGGKIPATLSVKLPVIITWDHLIRTTMDVAVSDKD